MTQLTLYKASRNALPGLLVLAALALPVQGFADTSTPPNTVGIPSSTELIVERGHRVEKPGRHDNGQSPVQPVPEPGTMALVGMGVVALGATLRRRMSRQQ